MATKMTKIEKFVAIKEILESTGADAELIEAMDKEVELITNKASKAKSKASAKSAEYVETIMEALTSEAQTLAELSEKTGLTSQRISGLVKAFVDSGDVVKEEVKIEKSKRMTYRLA